MRIAIPTNGYNGLKERVADHFGRCKTYTVLTDKGEVVETINNKSEHGGGVGLPPEFLIKNKINVLICFGIGIRALKLCEQLGINVYMCDSGTVKQTIDLWKENKLKKASSGDACDH